jgi:superfamily II DNA or RNA helicase
MKGPDINDILREEGDEGVRRCSDNARKVSNVTAADVTGLRDYQVRALKQLDAANCAIYVLPTGGGKTVVFCELIKILAARGERILVIVHRTEILNQTSRKLQLLGIDHGIIKACRVANPECLVQ